MHGSYDSHGETRDAFHEPRDTVIIEERSTLGTVVAAIVLAVVIIATVAFAWYFLAGPGEGALTLPGDRPEARVQATAEP